ncbi:MAG: hypothetical protein AAGK74_20605, partial [Chloroflexota bacterium]
MGTAIAKLNAAETTEREHGWRSEVAGFVYQLRRSPLVIIGIVTVVLWVLISLVAPVIAPVEPLTQDVASRLQAPGFTKTIELDDTEQTFRHLLGTDELGRDIYTRVIYGGRITIPAGLAVITFGSL